MSWQRVIGIDPGSRVCGYAIIETDRHAYRYVASGVLKVAQFDLPQRLNRIFHYLSEAIDTHKPDAASIEEVFMASNARAALLLGQARGAAICSIANRAIPVYEYSAKTVKKSITGHGNADKNQVCFMVCRLLQVAEREHRDETDAMAIALCHAFHLTPEMHREATR